MDNNTFFSSKNTDLIYTICRDEVLKKTQYNIDSNKKYYTVFGEIMKIVYKHNGDQADLTLLNNKTIGKTIPYLVDEIEKKQLKNKPLIPSTNIVNAPPIRGESIASRDIPNRTGLPVSFRAQSTERDNDPNNLKNNYERIMSERKELHEQVPENISMTVEDNSQYEDPMVLMERQRNERDLNVDQQHLPNLQQDSRTLQAGSRPNLDQNNPPRVQKTFLETQSKNRNPDISLDSYDLDNGVLDDLYGNTDMSEMNTYNPDNDTIDPMKLFELQNQNRERENSDYLNIQKSAINFEEHQKMGNQVVEKMKSSTVNKNNYEASFNTSLSEQMDRKMNNINIETLKGQLDNRIEKNLQNVLPPTANDISNTLDEETVAYNKLKEDMFEKRNYINRENLLIINSGDRDWFTESEDRYAFQMRFDPTRDSYELVPKIDASNGLTVRTRQKDGKYYGDIVYEKKLFKGEQGLGVEKTFKNIVSFELIRVLMAIENIIIPFDNRFFIDYKSLPYITLKVDELQPLYIGTNHRVNNSFAKLLFDKDHTNEVIVSPKDSSSPASPYTTKYSRQLKRGYSSMAPMSNEKKTFYPTPLATLNRLTISLLTPYGANIKNHEDVLTVSTVQFLALSSLTLELDNSSGFPNDNADDTATYYVEITTTTAFSNRVFKIGDNIRFKGFDSDNADSNTNTFIDFMNKEEGHYIVNQQLEVIGQNKNEGYITKFYIPPPGEVSYGAAASKTGNYVISAATDLLKSGTTSKLINQSIQTHFVFKIITREDDTTKFIKPANI
jgi:hypothetical protein